MPTGVTKYKEFKVLNHAKIIIRFNVYLHQALQRHFYQTQPFNQNILGEVFDWWKKSYDCLIAQIVRVLSKKNDRSIDGMFVVLKSSCTC